MSHKRDSHEAELGWWAKEEPVDEPEEGCPEVGVTDVADLGGGTARGACGAAADAAALEAGR